MIRVIRYHGGKSIPYRLPDFRPGDVRDVEIDLTGELHGDTISTATWSIEPTAVTIGTPTNTDTTTTATITAPDEPSVPSTLFRFVRGYRVAVTVTTSGGETITTPMILWVRSGFE